jgi:hypothetical protein
MYLPTSQDIEIQEHIYIIKSDKNHGKYHHNLLCPKYIFEEF